MWGCTIRGCQVRSKWPTVEKPIRQADCDMEKTTYSCTVRTELHTLALPCVVGPLHNNFQAPTRQSAITQRCRCPSQYVTRSPQQKRLAVQPVIASSVTAMTPQLQGRSIRRCSMRSSTPCTGLLVERLRRPGSHSTATGRQRLSCYALARRDTGAAGAADVSATPDVSATAKRAADASSASSSLPEVDWTRYHLQVTDLQRVMQAVLGANNALLPAAVGRP